MLRTPSENTFSSLRSNIQTRGTDEVERASETATESQTMMESKMSSQSFTHTNGHHPSLAGAALVNLARHIWDGLSAFGRRFMNALYESRLRQANRIIRQHQHLIDHSND